MDSKGSAFGGGPGGSAPWRVRGGAPAFHQDLHAISLIEGARAALAVAAIVALDQWMSRPPLMEAALGALFVCLADAGGPIRRRIPGMVAFAVLGALATAAFGLSRALPLYVMIPLACLGVMATGFARVWGPIAMQVGNLLTVVIVFAVYRPMGWAQAGIIAAAFLGGSVWAALLTLVIWRLHPFGPARAAIAECYRQLALAAREMRHLAEGASGIAAWEAHARRHRRAVREAIERARSAVKEGVRWRGTPTPRLAQGLVRIEAAEQIFGALIALSDILEQDEDRAMRPEAGRALRLIAPALAMLGAAGRADRALPEARLDAAIGRIAAEAARAPRIAPMLDAITERLRIAATMSLPTALAPTDPQEGEPALPVLTRLVQPVRSNLAWQSSTLRHALRCAVLTAPALAITLPHYRGYEHWLTITLVMTTQPCFGNTWQRAVERIGGTVLGGVAAAALGLVCTTPSTVALALFPLSIFAFAVRSVSYGAFIAGLTPIVVLLSELGRPGSSELAIAVIRAAYTLVGGIAAVIGVMVLWPSWEPDRLRGELQTAIAAHARYADAVLGRAEAETVEAARRAAGLASNNLETSIARLLLEPGQAAAKPRAGPDRLEAAMLVDTALRRLAGRLAALRLTAEPDAGMDAADWAAWREWIATALAGLQQMPPPAPPRPAARPVEALARIGRQIELMQGALMRGA